MRPWLLLVALAAPACSHDVSFLSLWEADPEDAGSRVDGEAKDATSDRSASRTWKLVEDNAVLEAKEDFMAVWGVEGEIWVAGGLHVLCRQASGGDWKGTTIDKADTLVGIWGASSSKVWAVSAGDTVGQIYEVQGLNPQLALSAKPKLAGIWGSAATDVWAVGDRLLTWHYDGTRWGEVVPRSDTMDQELNEVWRGGEWLWSGGVSPSQAARVWRARTVAPADQVNWSPEKDWSGEEKGRLDGIWGRAAEDIWFVGTDKYSAGLIVHREGTMWAAVQRGEFPPLHDVWGCPNGETWAVGAKGTVIRNDGQSWHDENTPLTGKGKDAPALHGVWCSPQNEVWIVGNNSTILRSSW